ncbi:MAG: hypothetical protein AAF547_20090 [Actinomycetota bacterium]
MTNAHHPEPYGASSRPQSFWLLSAMTMAALVLLMGRAFPANGEGAPRFDGASLIELANPSSGRASGATDPQPLIEAPRLGPRDRDSGDRIIPVDPAAPTRTDDAATADAPDSVAFEDLDGPEARGQAALAMVSYPWEQLLGDWSIEFLDGRPGLYGLTLVPERRIEIYVRDDQSRDLLAHVIAHELGHAVDVTFNDGPDRRAWEGARGIHDSPWWPGNGTTDFSTGAGDFAESFAAWQVGSSAFRSTLAEPPNDEQIELLAQLAAG